MLTDQAARNPGARILSAPVVAKSVLGGVAMQVLGRNLMVDTENAALEQAEETLGGVDVDAGLAFGAGVLARRVRDAVGLLPNQS